MGRNNLYKHQPLCAPCGGRLFYCRRPFRFASALAAPGKPLENIAGQDVDISYRIATVKASGGGGRQASLATAAASQLRTATSRYIPSTKVNAATRILSNDDTRASPLAWWIYDDGSAVSRKNEAQSTFVHAESSLHRGRVPEAELLGMRPAQNEPANSPALSALLPGVPSCTREFAAFRAIPGREPG